MKKSIVLALGMLLSFQALGAGITASDLRGYVAGKMAIPGPYMAVELFVMDNGTYSYREGNMEYVSPAGACVGDFEIRNQVFLGEMWCQGMASHERIYHEIDLRGVTPSALKRGVTVNVKSSAFGDTAIPFTFKKLNKAFF